ncbi:MAG: hypothetical protein WDO73_16175 [Ignavibacteriota bacterium]
MYLDAYPDLALPAHLEFASPVASSALMSPIKTFTAVFRIDRGDSRLLPDLSAALVVDPKPAKREHAVSPAPAPFHRTIRRARSHTPKNAVPAPRPLSAASGFASGLRSPLCCW